MIHTYQEALNYLNSFLNLEKKPDYSYKESLKLQRVSKAADYLGILHNQLKAIHVAGTKGKGSTTHYLAYCLAASGYKVGVFSSPHFFTFRERIKTIEFKEDIFQEKLISPKRVTTIIKDFQRKLEFLSEPDLTYFELITLIGFKYFVQEKLDYVVVEVGLGGRLDSTNIISPKLSIITHIGYDHMHLLGNSLAQIAYEKAGIIKDRVPVIVCYQRSSAAEIIRKEAKKRRASLYVLGRDFQITNVRLQDKYTLFDFSFGQRKIENIKIFQKGYYQAENASLALASLSILIGEKNIRKQTPKRALSRCAFEGRFEIISKDPLVIVDVAHNKSSALVVSDNLKKYFPEKKVILVFSCSTDKKPNQMLSAINYNHLILTQFNQPRSYNVFELRDILWRKRAKVTMNLTEALTEARSSCDRQSLILICGSFFLAAEAKAIFKKERKKVKKLCLSLT